MTKSELNGLLYREMHKDELHRVGELDRREKIEYNYYLLDDRLALKKVNFDVPEWSEDKKSQIHQLLLVIYQRSGTIIGAFNGTTVAGIAALDHDFFGKNMEHLNLGGLWVSQPFRNQGVGRHLVNLIKTKAKKLGAKYLYCSATPSKKTVEFYMSCDFQLAKIIDPHLFELEPEDIHLECKL
jgi:GNAT superfamily N-acetyltransferase